MFISILVSQIMIGVGHARIVVYGNSPFSLACNFIEGFQMIDHLLLVASFPLTHNTFFLMSLIGGMR